MTHTDAMNEQEAKEDYHKEQLKRIASNIAFHCTKGNIDALIECDMGMMHEVISQPHRGGSGKWDYYCSGKTSVHQIKALHKMGAIADDFEHPDKVKHTGIGSDYTTYYKLSDLGQYILKKAANWYNKAAWKEGYYMKKGINI